MASIPPDTPMAPPPPGVESNFDDPESRGYQLVAVVGVSLSFMVVAVACRVYTKLAVVKDWSIDDYAIILAAVTSIATSALHISQLGCFLGLHIWDIRLLDYLECQPRIFAGYSIYLVSNMCFRLSILLLYLRLFAPVPRIRYLIFGGIAVVLLYNISAWIAHLVTCVPSRDDSGLYQAPATCKEGMRIIASIQTAFNCATDIYLLVIPIQPVWALQISRRTKIAIYIIFMAGVGALICSTMRFVWQFYYDKNDPTWDLIPPFIVTTVELNIGIMCACLPLLAKLAREYRKRGSSKASSYGYSTSRSGPSRPSHNSTNHTQSAGAMPKGSSSSHWSGAPYDNDDDHKATDDEHQGSPSLPPV